MRLALSAEYHAWSSGPVVLSTRYGMPTVPDSSARMCRMGCSAAIDFQLEPGRIGRSSRLPASRARCTRACTLGFSHPTDQYEYRYPSSSVVWKNIRQVVQTAAV